MTTSSRDIIAERTRTIDQIKRLYAVVMGYSVTSCFTNMYACARIISSDMTIGISIILAQGLVFVSLIALFYLGAERLLDKRYLQADSKVPSRHGLLFDLLCLGATAAWFVILADTFPNVSQASLTAGDLRHGMRLFIINLLVLTPPTAFWSWFSLSASGGIVEQVFAQVSARTCGGFFSTLYRRSLFSAGFRD
jgi:hypothetical protein